MITDERIAFGTLLKRYRGVAGLTQEELAEHAGLSARAVSDLERGVNTRPRPYTVHQLAEALGLSPDDRATFERAAIPAATPAPEGDLARGNFLGALPSGDLIGREEECERIHSILSTVAEGTGQVVLFSGETGTGKTRLLQQVMLAARARSFLVTTSRCNAADDETPYYPFLEALRGLVARSPVRASPEIQRRWKKIQGLMAAVSDTSGSVAGQAVAQQEISLAVSDLLLLGAEEAPLALLLDDVQWADSSSFKLLEYLSRTTHGSRVLLAGAFRDLRLTEEHPDLAHTLQTLSRERLAERITVRRLSLEETTTLVGATMGQDEVSEAFASFAYRRTKGVPRLIDQLVRSLGGRLELQGEIGVGAIGRVFRAYDRMLEQTVAAKVVLARQEIDLDTLLRFQQEGAVLSTLDHPHIVDIYDTFAEEHASCIIMELLEGQSLGQILQHGPLPLLRAKNIVQQVAKALEYAHSQGIIHRDVKPDNVMMMGDDEVKVTDFGIARILQPDTSLQTIATTGMRMGTPLYMAPEQIEGKKIDARTDVYALGAMLCHMVTGGPPFEGNDALAVAVKHLQEELVPPSQINPDIPAGFSALIVKAMAKDPAKRFQSAREMDDALDALDASAGFGSLAATAGRSRRLFATAGVTAVCAGIFAAMWVHGATRSQQAGQGSNMATYLSDLATHGRLSGTVLVAQRGKILINRGYGLADRGKHVPNTPTTTYPIEGAGFAMSLLVGLELEEQGKLHGSDRVCSYLSACPHSWKPMTVRMLLDGTSGLQEYAWGQPKHTPTQSLAGCQAAGVQAAPGTHLSYQNCTVIVLGAIIEKITGKSWANVVRQLIFKPAGMVHSGRITDDRAPPALAQSYAGNVATGPGVYNDFFETYSTVNDVYAYDNALFARRLIPQQALNRMFAARPSSALAPDLGVENLRSGYLWKIGTVSGHRAIYTSENVYSFSDVNMRFPGEGITVIVIGNADKTNAEDVAVHVARLVLGKSPAPPVASPPRAVALSKAVVARINVPNGFWVSAGNGELWATSASNGKVSRIDPRVNRVVSTMRAAPPKADVAGFIAGGQGQVWTEDQPGDAIVRIDSRTNKVVARVPVGITPNGLTISGHTLWTATPDADDDPVHDKRTIVRVDLRSQRVVATITNATTDLGDPFLILAASRTGLWFVDWASSTVKRIDPATNKVVAVIHTGPKPSSVAIGEGAVWVANHYSNLLTRIDPRTNRVIASIPVHGIPSGDISADCCGGTVAAGDGSVWTIAGAANRTLVRIDPRTNQATATLTFPQGIDDIVVANGSVWVMQSTFSPSCQLIRIDPRAMQ